MPKFYEVYGQPVTIKTKAEETDRSLALCPFTQNTCDGGGNRHQTKIRLNNSPLRSVFDKSLDSVIPGICAIEYKENETWIVCPRRLLGFNPPAQNRLTVNFSLGEHERNALLECGLPTNKELGVWSEVYLQFGSDDTAINYHFDFIIAELKHNISMNQLFADYSIDGEAEQEEIRKSAKTGGYLTGRYDPDKPISLLPDLSTPTIIEVMTASTSGSDREARTDIASSFEDALLGKDYNCPGINKRQVWGRMATQLFAKSALAEDWGGKTVWLVQDELIKNIELTTKLQLAQAKNDTEGTVNFLSMTYKANSKGVGSLVVKSFDQKNSGLDFSGSGDCSDILLPKVTPSKTELLKSVLRREISAVIRL